MSDKTPEQPAAAGQVEGVADNADPHPIVEALVVDPADPPTFVTVEGFIGKSSQEGCIRLYLDEDLGRWFDIPKPIIVHIEKLPPEISRLGPSVLWLDRKRKQANGHGQGASGKFP